MPVTTHCRTSSSLWAFAAGLLLFSASLTLPAAPAVAGETDTDGDGIFDHIDNCLDDPNPDQRDTDGDGEGDECDADDDNDGVADGADNCPITPLDLPAPVENFAEVEGLVTNGAARQTGRLRVCLDDRSFGSIWREERLALEADGSFSTMFRPAFHGGGGDDGASGLVFVLQNSGDGTAALGGGGAGLGYVGLSPSVAVEFDTAVSNGGDPNDNHVAVLINGSIGNHQAVEADLPFDFNQRGTTGFYAWVDYDGTRDLLEIYLATSDVKPETPSLVHTIDIPAIVGDTPYVGFAASAGVGGNIHDIRAWSIADSDPDQTDLDNDGMGDPCDVDDDDDGVDDAIDNCPRTANPDQNDRNEDGVGDACDDPDADGILDSHDNCPDDANPDQENQDGDGFGDACDNCPADGEEAWIDRADFNGVEGLRANGSAAIAGSLLLNRGAGEIQNDVRGSIFSSSPQPADTFSTKFQVQIDQGGGQGDAHGVAFVLHADPRGAAALGGHRQELGYSGITPSVVVELDIKDVNNFDPNNNHIAVHLDGDHMVNEVNRRPGGFDMNPPDGTPFFIWIDYDDIGHTLSVFAALEDLKPDTPRFTHGIDITAHLGDAWYIGFTSAAEADGERQQVTYWRYARPSRDQTDTDGDGMGNICDADDDDDGVADQDDNCTLVPNVDQLDTDSDGDGNACDDDDDDDGVPDGEDICPLHADADQADVDNDGLGDACDPDDDNDLRTDGNDNCPRDPNPDQADFDNDGQGDVCDLDADNDGVPSAEDNCPVGPGERLFGRGSFSDDPMVRNGDATSNVATVVLASGASSTGSAFVEEPMVTADAAFVDIAMDLVMDGGPVQDRRHGLALILHGDDRGIRALGGGAEGMGYAGIERSLVVEFDISQTEGDANGNHVAVMVGGNAQEHAAQAEPPFDLANTGTFSAWITYTLQTQTLAVYVSENRGQRPNDPLFTHQLDLRALVGDVVHVGLTGASDGATRLRLDRLVVLRDAATQLDSDNDGAGDLCDVCRTTPDPEQSDADDDGLGDACDLCPMIPRPQDDTDADGVGDDCDNCPSAPNADQLDSDQDGVGDACTMLVAEVGPAAHAISVSATPSFHVSFTLPVDPQTLDAAFSLRGSLSGSVPLVTELAEGDDHTVIVRPAPEVRLWAGERVWLDVHRGPSVAFPEAQGLSSVRGDTVRDGWSQDAWVVVENPADGFVRSGQALANQASFDVALGDLDGDGDLDAFVANSSGQANRVWLGDGAGGFTDSGARLGNRNSEGVALGDVDGDGDLDAFVANFSGHPNYVWLGDGDGNFVDSGLRLGSASSRSVRMADFDGDGDLDALVANANANSQLWIGDGAGGFIAGDGEVGSGSRGVTLGDLNDDGFVDAFLAVFRARDRTLVGDGQGDLSPAFSGEGDANTQDAAMGDLDGDGLLDVLIVGGGANQVWLGEGDGTLRDTGAALPAASDDVTLVDVDGDGDLDAFFANVNAPDSLFLNNGQAGFSDAGFQGDDDRSRGIALGDLDGDGDLDAFVAVGGAPNRVYFAVGAPRPDDDTYTTTQDTTLVVPAPGVLEGDVVPNPARAIVLRVVDGPAHGSLQFAGDGSFEYTPDGGFRGLDAFTYTVDNGVESLPARVGIQVTPGNQAPVASDQTVTTDEDTELGIALLASDVDGDELLFEIITSPSRGVLTGLDPVNGTVTYTPAGNFAGSDAFTFRVFDGEVHSELATVSVTVRSINDAPSALGQRVTTAQDTSLDVVLSGSDVDGDTLTFVIVDGPSRGTLAAFEAAEGTVTYAPEVEFTGADSFTWRVEDGASSSDTVTVEITVGGDNAAPVAVNSTATVAEGGALAQTLVATDEDGDALTFTLVGAPANGTLIDFDSAAGTVTYVASGDFHGDDEFSFRASDGTLDSNVATVSVTVQPVNDAPVAYARTAEGVEDSPVSVALNATDADGDALTFAIATPTANGTLQLDADTGVATYEPAPNFHGSDTFTFTASDGVELSAAARVTLTISPANDIPIAQPQTVSTAEDTELAIVLGAVDIDGDALSWTVVAGPQNGSLRDLDVGAGTVTYVPDGDYHGSDSLTFRVSDGLETSEVATVSIEVEPRNDAPVATSATTTTDEDVAVVVTLPAGDVDGDDLTFEILTSPASGALSEFDPAAGIVTYTPAANAHGEVTFTWRASDGALGSEIAVATVVVDSVNDAPESVRADWVTGQDTDVDVQLIAFDVDGDPLQFAIESPPGNGQLSNFNEDTGSVTYSPPLEFSGLVTFTFTATDGLASSGEAVIAIHVGADNAAPVAFDQDAELERGDTLALTLTATDADADTLAYEIVQPPAHGALEGLDTATGEVTYRPEPNYVGPDSFSFRVRDGVLHSNLAVVTLDVLPVNNAPVADAQGLATSEDVALAVTLTGSDADGDDLTFAVVTAPGEGALIDFNTAAGTAIYVPAANFAGTDSFTFTVSDGRLVSDPATVAIQVEPVNDLPTASAVDIATSEDQAVEVQLVGADVEGPVRFELVAAPEHGTATDLDEETGTVTYTPAANFHGADSFTFRVTDGDAVSAPAAVSISVSPTNDAPVAQPLRVETLEDTPRGLQMVATDVEGDALTFEIVAGPNAGTLSDFDADNGTATYSPGTNFNGEDTLTFRVTDGQAQSEVAAVVIAVLPVDDAPVAVGQSTSTDEDVEVDIQLAGSDVDGDPLTFEILRDPANGVLGGFDGNQGTVTYTPDANFNGEDSFSFRVSDGVSDSQPATVTITVGGLNDAPVAVAGSATLEEDESRDLVLTATDSDGDDLTFEIIDAPAHGALSAFDANAGTVTYTPTAHRHGADAFTFRASDGALDSNIATVTLEITPINDAPIANGRAVDGVEDQSLDILLTGSDVDGDELRFAVGSAPAHGELTLDPATGETTYTPEPNFHGADVFTFTVTDGEASSAPAQVTLSIAAVNDAPVAQAQTAAAVEDTALPLVLGAIDVDGDDLTWEIVQQPEHGTLQDFLPGSGTATYAPASNYHGPDAFTFRVSDGVATSAPATVSIDVASRNDAPVAAPVSATPLEDNAVTVNFDGRDADGDELTYEIVAPPAEGQLSDLDALAGTVTYTPPRNAHGAFTFTYRASDGVLDSNTAVATVTVTPVNDAPVAFAAALATDEDTALDVQLIGLDVDGDALRFLLDAEPSNGELSDFDEEAGTVTYTPDADYVGVDAFSFSVSDGQVESDTVTVTIDIGGQNDAPVAMDVFAELDEDDAVLLALSAADPDGDAVTYTIVEAPSHGEIRDLDPDTGEFIYAVELGYNGEDSFTYRASDGALDSNIATVTLLVNATNDAPVADSIRVTTTEDTPLDITLTGSDEEGDALTFAIVAQPGTGTLQGLDDEAGTVTYAPAANFHGEVSFEFTVSDGGLTSEPATVTILVDPVNDVPTVMDVDASVAEDDAVQITLTGMDVEGPVTFELASQPVNGTLSEVDLGAGTLTYTPDADFHGEDAFTFRAHDGEATSATAEVRVLVTPVNDAPTAQDQDVEVSEETAVVIMLGGNDIDDDTLTFAIATDPENGGLSDLDPETGAVTYTPADQFGGTDSFTFTVSDGQVTSAPATVSIVVLSENDAPVATPLQAEVAEDGTVVLTLAGTDADGDDLVYALATAPEQGTASDLDAETGLVTYTPDADFHGEDVFTFTVSDGALVSEPAAVTITVTPVNDPPMFVPPTPDQVVEGVEGTEMTFEVAAVDPDGDDLTFSAQDLPPGAALSETTGGFSWTPADYTQTGGFTFTLSVSDGTAIDTREVELAVVFLDEDEDGLPDSWEVEEGLDPTNRDTDKDAISDGEEVGDWRDPADTDEDGTLDALDSDSDNDGVGDLEESGDQNLDTAAIDTDGDETPDYRDLDSDDDGVDDGDDNCRLVVNADQADLDGDGEGDLCEDDLDGDTIVDADDNCPTVANLDQADTDDNGVGDACDTEPEPDPDPNVEVDEPDAGCACETTGRPPSSGLLRLLQRR